MAEDKTGVWTEHVLLHPARAIELFENRARNRHLKVSGVTYFLECLRVPGGFQPEVGRIRLDSEGRVIDGQHKLKAIIMFGEAVPVVIEHNVTKEMLRVIDQSGAGVRTLGDQLAIFRGEGMSENRNLRVAYLQTCLYLYSGSLHRVVHNMAQFDVFYEPFKIGIEAVLKVVAGSRIIQNAPVAGALAFAHAFAPEKTLEFAKQLASGEGLHAGDPALTLRKMLIETRRTSRQGVHMTLTQQRQESTGVIARKVLNGLAAYIDGEKMSKALDSDRPRAQFKTAYDGYRKLRDLVNQRKLDYALVHNALKPTAKAASQALLASIEADKAEIEGPHNEHGAKAPVVRKKKD